MQFNCQEYFSKNLLFWDKMTPQQAQLLCSRTSLAEYEKGQTIHGSSGKCTGAMLVKTGVLRTYMLSEEGKEITLYRLYPGELCMLSASCVLQTITFEVFVDAEEKSQCYIINPEAFSKIVDENIYVENFALKSATSRFSEVMWVMQQILFMSFDRRLAVFLTEELSKEGGDTVRLTQEQIAKYMGSAREVVSRMLKHFAAEKLVEVSRGGVKVLDMEGLKAIAG